MKDRRVAQMYRRRYTIGEGRRLDSGYSVDDYAILAEDGSPITSEADEQILYEPGS